MKKETKLLVFTVIVSVVAIVLIVARYERLLKLAKDDKQFAPVAGGVASVKNYTASEIIGLIKKDKQYIGDSITIFDDGKMTSSNGKFQGTLNAVIDSKDNMDAVKGDMNNNRLPIQYNIYHLAAIYYRGQYPDEFKSK
jgi:hypothetical protein